MILLSRLFRRRPRADAQTTIRTFMRRLALIAPRQGRNASCGR